MIRIKVFSIFLSTVFFVSICAILSLFSPVWAGDCTSTLSHDFKVHIPTIQFDTGLYSLDLQYAPSNDGIIWFDIVRADVVDTLNCNNPAFLFPVSGTFSLYVPSMVYGADKYWMTLIYMTGRTGTSPKEGFAVTGFNSENVMAPPGTKRVPTKMMFGSSISVQISCWTCTYKMKSDLIALVGDSLASLTSPGFLFGAASGFLYADGYCSFIPIPEVPELTGTMTIEGMGTGLFYIDSITITDVETSMPQITMKYHLKFNPGQIIQSGRLCYNGDCNEWTEDITESLILFYNDFHMSEMTGGLNRFEALGWNLLPGSGTPCNGCGWPYAKKAYPYQEIQFDGGSKEELGTVMALYE